MHAELCITNKSFYHLIWVSFHPKHSLFPPPHYSIILDEAYLILHEFTNRNSLFKMKNMCIDSGLKCTYFSSIYKVEMYDLQIQSLISNQLLLPHVLLEIEKATIVLVILPLNSICLESCKKIMNQYRTIRIIYWNIMLTSNNMLKVDRRNIFGIHF